MLENKIELLANAINNLADAIRSNNISVSAGTAPVAIEFTQPDAKADIPQTPVNPTTSVVAPVQTPTNTQPINNTVAVNAAASAPTAPAPSEVAVNYTIEQLSVAGAALCEQGKMAQLIALLGKYGVQAVTQLKPTPDVLNPFAAELKALGANL